MPTLKEHLQKHSKIALNHVKTHHKKYIFGLVGWTITIKLVFTLMASVSLYELRDTFAQDINLEQWIANISETPPPPEETTPPPEETTTPPEETTTPPEETTTPPEETTTPPEETTTLPEETTTPPEETTTTTPEEEEFWFDSNTSADICDNSNFVFINPLSGSKIKWDIIFSRTYTWSACSGKNFDIYLRDHNQQYISIWTSSYLDTRMQFDSSWLYSGFYDILSNSGDVLYTWQYSGLNSNFYTGYKIRFVDQNQNIVYTGDVFTIDNQIPEITGLVLDYTWNYMSWYIWLSWIVNLAFTASEELTWVVVSLLGTNANLVNKSGLDYKYSMLLSGQNSWSNLLYNISFTDLAGNTGAKYHTSNVIFDKLMPVLNYISFTGTYTWVNINWSGNEISRYDFVYALTGNQTWINMQSTNYLYTWNINISWLNQTRVYNFLLRLTDLVNNSLTIWWNFYFNTSWKVLFIYDTISQSSTWSTLMFTTSSLTWSTWQIATVSNILKQEVNKFNQCRDWVKTTSINIKMNDHTIKLNMPSFEKSYVRTLVNSFTIVMMDKLKNKKLQSTDLDDIINRFDNFLVILKLVRDDENQCKQNLSNYHIRLFQKTLEEYNISL